MTKLKFAWLPKESVRNLEYFLNALDEEDDIDLRQYTDILDICYVKINNIINKLKSDFNLLILWLRYHHKLISLKPENINLWDKIHTTHESIRMYAKQKKDDKNEFRFLTKEFSDKHVFTKQMPNFLKQLTSLGKLMRWGTDDINLKTPFVDLDEYDLEEIDNNLKNAKKNVLKYEIYYINDPWNKDQCIVSINRLIYYGKLLSVVEDTWKELEQTALIQIDKYRKSIIDELKKIESFENTYTRNILSIPLNNKYIKMFIKVFEEDFEIIKLCIEEMDNGHRPLIPINEYYWDEDVDSPGNKHKLEAYKINDSLTLDNTVSNIKKYALPIIEDLDKPQPLREDESHNYENDYIPESKPRHVLPVNDVIKESEQYEDYDETQSESSESDESEDINDNWDRNIPLSKTDLTNKGIYSNEERSSKVNQPDLFFDNTSRTVKKRVDTPFPSMIRNKSDNTNTERFIEENTGNDQTENLSQPLIINTKLNGIPNLDTGYNSTNKIPQLKNSNESKMKSENYTQIFPLSKIGQSDENINTLPVLKTSNIETINDEFTKMKITEPIVINATSGHDTLNKNIISKYKTSDRNKLLATQKLGEKMGALLSTMNSLIDLGERSIQSSIKQNPGVQNNVKQNSENIHILDTENIESIQKDSQKVDIFKNPILQPRFKLLDSPFQLNETIKDGEVLKSDILQPAVLTDNDNIVENKVETEEDNTVETDSKPEDDILEQLVTRIRNAKVDDTEIDVEKK